MNVQMNEFPEGTHGYFCKCMECIKMSIEVYRVPDEKGRTRDTHRFLFDLCRHNTLTFFCPAYKNHYFIFVLFFIQNYYICLF